MPYVDLAREPAEMRRIFVSLGLASVDEEVHAAALAGGVSSGIYRVDLRSGSYCLKQALPQLKVAKEWKVPVERVFSEVAYLRCVDSIVPGHVPRVLGVDEATKSFVMPFLGPEFRNWKTLMLAGHVDVPIARQAGDMLGRVHAATADRGEISEAFATDENFYAIRLEPYLVETARVHPSMSGVLHGLVERTASARRVLVHGDVSPKNILAGPQGPVLLDAECAWFGDPAFDLAFCLNHFLLKAVHLPGHIEPLMASYAAMKQAYFAHVHWEPREELEARVASLLPGLTLARVDGKSPVEYLGEPQRDVVRKLASNLLAQSPASLDVIATAWAWELMA